MSAKQPFDSLRRLALVVALACLAAMTAEAPAFAGKRVALVIGNSAYRSVPQLSNPANDARLIARTLRGLGFALVGGDAQVDLDKPHFDAALQSFSDQLLGAEVSLFYYAGHGLQVGGKNFLVPIEAHPTKEADAFLQMIDTSIVLSQMEGSGARLNIVLLDACRNNPFAGRGSRDSAGGLAQMQAPEGTLISYATQPGAVAQDGADGDSPYTKALAATIARPGLGLFDAFNEVGLAVKRATGGAQQPWVSSSPIDGVFYFAGPAPGATASASAEAAGASPAPKVAASAATGETANPPGDGVPAPAVAAPAKTASLGAAAAAAPPTEPGATVGACDRLAASPLDPERPAAVAGMKFERIDPGQAVTACRAALLEQPENARLIYQLARALSRGGGSSAEAVALFRKAAAGGHAGAMNSLGLAYDHGAGVARDVAQALDWYRRSAQAGNSAAMHRLGVAFRTGAGLPRDPVEALRWFRKSADLGNTLGMADVGLAYADGAGVARNPSEAVRWYRMAAEADGVLGMVRLGAAYQRGFGIARDPVEAMRWFHRAAEAGNVSAMETLGAAYRDGVGVARDEAEAERWFRKAQQ